MIILPNLHDFGIEGEVDTRDSLFSMLDLPALNVLHLYTKANHNPDPSAPLEAFLLRCKSLDKLILNPYSMSLATLKGVMESASGITQLVLDHCFVTNGGSSSGHRDRTLPSSIQELRPCGSPYPGYLPPLIPAPELSEPSSAPPHLQPNVPLPNLKSFSGTIAVASDGYYPKALFHFLRSRIHPADPKLWTPERQRCASLETVVLRIDGHPELNFGRDADDEFDLSVNLEVEVARYAESVGRTVGVDIFLDITYPWKHLYETDANLEWRQPGILVPAKAGLDMDTDHTWMFADGDITFG
ncbi:hypothetical protein CVT24_007684 [Panaeolus cyanescens]|uniref:Uncharacterized protein n=1 Tax=Panaeolus cyanescens TaxID=181874 RepID=A0A409VRG3_9AGAR|nr:hypothetical protein CVT24_007684 [Panaeolus cyanescens]